MSKFNEWLQKVTGNIKSGFDNLFKKKDATQTTQPAVTEAAQPLANKQAQTTGMANPNIAPKIDAVEGNKETPQNTNTQNQPTANQPNNFLDWYKNKTGGDFNGTFNRTEGMSDQDYESGNALYQKYLQKQNLENQFNSANQAIDTSTDKQRQESSILRDKMAKYINLQNKNTGLENMGVGESTKLQADTTYMNNLGQIESEAQAQKQNLLNNYMNNQTNIDIESAREQQGIMDKYQQLAREDEQREYDRQQDEYQKQKYEEEQEYNKKKYEEEQAYQREQDALAKQRYEQEQLRNQQAASYNEFMSIVESGSFNTAAELESFYGKYKDKLSPEQQAAAEQYINFYKNNPDQQQLDKETEANKTGVIKEVDNGDGTKTITTRDENGNETTVTKDKDGNIIKTETKDSPELAAKKEEEKTQRILEGKEYINYNGKNYQIKSKLSTNANEITKNDSFTKKLKELGFTNPYDKNIPDGTTFDIKVDAAGKDQTNAWDWIAGILTVGMSTLGMQAIYNKTVTYYKGSWYVSEKK